MTGGSNVGLTTSRGQLLFGTHMSIVTDVLQTVAHPTRKIFYKAKLSCLERGGTCSASRPLHPSTPPRLRWHRIEPGRQTGKTTQAMRDCCQMNLPIISRHISCPLFPKYPSHGFVSTSGACASYDVLKEMFILAFSLPCLPLV